MAEKLKMMSDDIIQENIDYIASRFPNALKECKDDNGELVKRIDFDILKQELSNVVIDDKKERYQMTWPDKKKSILLANSKINATLRPVKEKSVDFDNTKNLYIEGDNLDVLKLLRETYLNKVKMIYIDPPYNTGNDFVYEDDFAQSSEEYLSKSGQYDEQGNRLVANSDSNGRFHTDWLNMMYPRLKVARDLLTDDGVIFISIDDNEVDNLRKVCDEIFGINNFICNIPRLTSAQRPSQEKFVSIQHDYILIYAKSKNVCSFRRTVVRSGLENAKKDNIGLYFDGDTSPILASSTQGYSSGGDYDFEYQGTIYKPIASDGTRRRWLWTRKRMEAAANLGILRPNKNGLRVQNYINKEFQLQTNVMVDKDPNLILASYDFMESNYTNNNGTGILTKLGLKFDFAKPTILIKELCKLCCSLNSNEIILDFFSGSATTAQSIFELNLIDHENRKFILVQLPEITKNEEFPTICDIGEERIRRAGKKIKDELIEKKNKAGLLAHDVMDPDSLDIGFRVLKLDSSNMNDVYYNPNAMTQSLLDETVDNIKPDRTSLDLLFQVMLELGIELSAKIEEKEVNGKHYYQVNGNGIVACFDDNLDNDILTEIAKLQPLYAVFKDSSFSTDSVGINNEQIFKTYSPQTKIKVL